MPFGRPVITAGFLYRAGAETPLNSRESFRVSPRTILKNFSAVDTQTAVLISTAEVWISAPDTRTPIFLGFSGYTRWLWFFRRETKNFGYFPEVPVWKLGSQHQFCVKTLPSRNPGVVVVAGGFWKFRGLSQLFWPSKIWEVEGHRWKKCCSSDSWLQCVGKGR